VHYTWLNGICTQSHQEKYDKIDQWLDNGFLGKLKYDNKNMTKSMTAFSRIESGNVTWEIRSVNHRYLDGTFKLPDSYRSLESKLRNEMRKQLDRGKVDCLLRVSQDLDEDQSIAINTIQLEKLNTAIEKTAAIISNPAPINILDVLRWPGILNSESANQSDLEERIRESFDAGLKSLTEMRAREGEELKKIIQEKLRELKVIVDAVKLEAPTIVARQKQKILDRLEDLNQDPDKNRLEQEMVYLAQKSDIAEELDRLYTHVEEVQTTLAQSGPVGRRLDFLMQELNREANTLSSKAVAANTSVQTVELKVIIEQMREQVQNIE